MPGSVKTAADFTSLAEVNPLHGGEAFPEPGSADRSSSLGAMLRNRALTVALLGLFACTRHSAEPAAFDVSPPAVTSESAPPPAPAGSSPATPRVLGAEAPLEGGYVQFEGMVRPSKGGYEVRGITLDGGQLSEGFAGHTPAHPDIDWLLGARVRVTANLVREGSDEESPVQGGLAVQGRRGAWLRVTRVDRVELVTEAATIEGVLAASKGMFSVAGHLVTRDDLGWSLLGKGDKLEGLRVRLWGQPRTVICEPNAQCLTTGSLPMFDIGRAEIVK